MFNDLRVSNSVSSQLPKYIAREYPNFVNFLKDYYKFLETNSNSLDLLNNIGDLINVETYTGIDLSTTLYSDIELDSKEVIVTGYVNFATNGLIKIEDEVILYDGLTQDIVDGNKVTKLSVIARGYTYNTLDIENGFTSNIKTVASSHTQGTLVYNQSYVYLLYFLEKLREQYLTDFPKNILADNLNKGLNIDNILKRVKDFYTTKGTPQGIDFYFKFLFQKTPELRNYRDSLLTPSNSIFEGKKIVRLRNLDNYDISKLIFRQIVQGDQEFTIISYESVYTFTSLAVEYEISNSENILPTEFTKIVSEPDFNAKRLFVDSTDGFPDQGILRYGDVFITYIQKQENYFLCDDSIFKLQNPNPQLPSNVVGKNVYDVNTLCVVKDDPQFYFSVYSGITDIGNTNNVGYAPNDVGFVSLVTLLDDPILNTWLYNDSMPLRKTKDILSSVTNVYYSDTDLYLTRSKAPFEIYPGESTGSSITLDPGQILSGVDKFVKIPRVFEQRNFKNRENTIPQFPVGLAIDGIPIMNWKSNEFITLGKIESIDIQNAGSNFNVANPPKILLDPPTTSDPNAVGATAELNINGHLSKINIESGGSGYPRNVLISVNKGVGNDPNIPFRQAIVSAVVVSGKITKIRIIDPGFGYTVPPAITISPTVSTPAVLSALVEGFIYNVNITNPGAIYTEDPQYIIEKGIGATASVTISNGKISEINVINGGSGYNSPPIVTITDSSGTGLGGEVIAKLGDGITTPVDEVESFVILNPGINYGENTVSVNIVESGTGELLNVRAQSWTPVNNYSRVIEPDGSYHEITNAVSQEVIYNYLGIPENLKYYDAVSNVYRNIPYTNSEWNNAGNAHSPIIGWAFDGAPIYGPFGYSDPLSKGSNVERMVSGYRKKTLSEISASNDQIRTQLSGLGLGNLELGYFAEDWVWVPNPFNLDENNGRYCVTPEFPDGVYAYFMTHSTDTNKNKDGFPYFVGSKYRGKTHNSFNIKENKSLDTITDNLSRFVTKFGDSYIIPEDPGNFIVDSIPESTDSTLFALEVVSPGDLYKVGDILEFDNTNTEGFGASGFVSSIKGKSITQVTKSFYDFFTYTEDTAQFQVGEIVKTNAGFEGTVFAVNPQKKEVYIDPIAGSPITPGELLFDDVNILNTFTGSKLSANITPAQTTINLTSDVEEKESRFLVDSVVGYQSGDYFEIGDEIVKVIFVDAPALRLIVIRGVNDSVAKAHTTAEPLTLISEITVYNSNLYVINDIIKLNNEFAKVVNINVNITEQVQAFNFIDNDLDGAVGPFYVFFNGELQNNGGDPTTVLQTTGSIIDDIVFTPTATEFEPLVIVEVGDGPTYETANLFAVEIEATTAIHTISIQRGLFGTSIGNHNKYDDVPIQTFISAKVTSYEQDKILTTFTVDTPELTPGDEIAVSTSLNKQENRTVEIIGGSINVSNTYPVTDVLGIDTGISFYEGYTYFFTAANNVDIDFFGPATNEDGELIAGNKYFDINIDKTFDNTNKLTDFIISPDSSDLTSYLMVITDPINPLVSKTILVKTLQEPINDNYEVLTSSASNFTVVNNIDPENSDVSVSDYTESTISYTTTSTSAKGPINFATLTSGGFSYVSSPGIKTIISDEGVGGVIEPITKSIGLILNVENKFSGYGFSSDFRQKPVVQFPRILQIRNNFKVTNVELTNAGSNYLFDPRVIVTGGGLPDNSPLHASLSASFVPFGSGSITVLQIENSGQQYNTAPNVNIEKYYFTTVTGTGSNTILTFKFPFDSYILQDDQFKVRLYYTQSGQEFIAESDIFFAKLEVNGVQCREESVASNPGAFGVDPTITGEIALVNFNDVEDFRYEYIALTRTATATAIVTKSAFIANERVTFNGNPNNFAFVTSNLGWQESSSILRVERFNTTINPGDVVFGESSKSTGIVSESLGTNAVPTLGTVIEQPKSFFNSNSFMGSNFEKIQDNLKYQRFAYEIGVDVPFTEWKENYISAAHPAGYNIFARTTIENETQIGSPGVLGSTNLTISTDIAEEVSFRRKYNYFVSKSQGFDEVQIYNKLLTDIKETEAAVVAVFEDISDQFNGVQTSFELKVVDPLNSTTFEGDPNYIEDYDVDQMIILLDNVIQTYGTSWFVTDSDKVISFTSSKNSGELLPDGEILAYRKVNDSTVVYESSEITTVNDDTFSILDADGNPWPAGIFSSIDVNNYLVVVDGAAQTPSSFTISGTNNGEIVFTEVLPIGTEISVRYLSGFLNNVFENVTEQSYTSGTVITLTSKPATVTSKESYFVFVDGALMTTDVYDIDANKDLIFNENFNYFTLMVFIDPLGVSLTTQTDDIVEEKYIYKINDGQEEIPEGFVIDSGSYILDISGVVQSPNIVYETISSGVRKINFTEPPAKVITSEDNPATPENEFSSVGRQFVGLLYQRSDPEGNTSTPNYQFDDISQNIIHVKENIDNFVIGDNIIRDDELSFGVISRKNSKITKIIAQSAQSGVIAPAASFTITINSLRGIFEGDRAIFNAGIGLTSPDNDELEITSINYLTNTITLTNISPSSLTINISIDTLIDFVHNTIEVINLNIDDSIPDKDDGFVDGSVILSGLASSQITSTITTVNEPSGVRLGTGVAVVEAVNVSGGALTGNANIVFNGGGDYTFTPSVTLVGGAGSGATATATVVGGEITQITLSGGSDYDAADLPTLVIEDPTQSSFNVTSVAGLGVNDYILINDVEICKITAINALELTVDRAQLNSNLIDFYVQGTSLQKIIPNQLTVKSFRRGFDGEKTTFKLTEGFQPVVLPVDSDIFVILNGVLQTVPDSYSLTSDGVTQSSITFTEAPQTSSPCNVFYLGQTIQVQDISSQFTGSRRVFDLRDPTGEIFSFNAKNKPEANISANLIIFIDGVYQIPSVESPGRLPAYDDIISSFRLFGSAIEFTDAPRFGSTFKAFIFVGSDDDYTDVDIEPPVESGDIIIQDDELFPRPVNNVLSSTTLSVNISKPKTVDDIEFFPNAIGINELYFSDLIQRTSVRESLRSRQLVSATVVSSPTFSNPTLDLSPGSVEIETIEEDFLPPVGEGDAAKFSFIIPASTNFSERIINATYATIQYNSVGTNETLNNVIIGVDLPFDQILEINSTNAALFDDLIYGSEITEGSNVISRPIINTVQNITYGPSTPYTQFGATVVRWDSTNRLLYLKLDNTANPAIIDPGRIRIAYSDSTVVEIPILDDDLIAEYQTLGAGTKIYSTT